MEHVLEVWQDGLRVAEIVGTDAAQVRAEAMHYAMIYSQDGPVEIRGGDTKPLFDEIVRAQEKQR